MDLAAVQRLLDELRGRLAIPEPVRVVLAPMNPRMASVEPSRDSDGIFFLSIQADFVEQLSFDELQATLAHELGHVWIFTHFPYLQTEELANKIAMRVVSRDSFPPLYAKVFGRSHTT